MGAGDEISLVRKCLKKDTASEYELYKKYFGTVKAICIRYANNREEISDLIQESFIRIFDSLAEFRFESNLGTWIYRITLNHCIRSRNKYLKNWFNETIHVEQDWPDDLYMETDDLPETPVILELIGKLPEGYKVVLTLYAVENMSHKDIAAQLGISEGTSRSQLYKARKMMKEMLEKYQNEKIN